MIRTFRTIGIAATLIALAACGKRADLEARAGQSAPALAYGQTVRPSTEDFTTPSAQARPTRSDELISRSAAREDDPFDFAPGRTVPPFPGTEQEEKAGEDKDKSKKPE